MAETITYLDSDRVKISEIVPQSEKETEYSLNEEQGKLSKLENTVGILNISLASINEKIVSAQKAVDDQKVLIAKIQSVIPEPPKEEDI